MWNNFFKHIDIKAQNTHILDGNAADLQAECQAFEDKITAAGGIELFVGGQEVTVLRMSYKQLHISDLSTLVSIAFTVIVEAVVIFRTTPFVLSGIGPDGHIAFNEPGSSLVSRTRVKTLAQDTIIANARFFDGDLSKVPTMALTVGVGTVMDAKEVRSRDECCPPVIYFFCLYYVSVALCFCKIDCILHVRRDCCFLSESLF